MSKGKHIPSSMGRKAEAAMKRAVRRLIAESRRTGAGLVVWQNGRVITLHYGKGIHAA